MNEKLKKKLQKAIIDATPTFPMFPQTGIRVFCGKCQTYFDETKVEFVHIEEDIQRQAVMTFICPTCKKKRRSKRLG